MKTFKINKLFILALVAMVFASCVQDDEFNVPNVDGTALNIPADQIVTINGLRAALEQEIADNGNQTLTFGEEFANQYVEGYVISSDEAGNFFEEIVLQDAASNPTTGVKVLIDSNPLFSRYDFGRRVYIKLAGLSVGFDSGVLALGIESAGSIEQIAESQMLNFVLRDATVAEIIPLEMNISDFADDMTNLYVRLTDVQFNRNQALGSDALTYAAEPTDEFDGERILESCNEGTSVVFSTSTFADFKAINLAQGRGSIDGILTYNFFGEVFNLVVNDLNGINLDDENRCDPDVYECNEPSGGGSEIYSQNFEQFNAIEDYVDLGWTNVNVANNTGELWVIGNFSNNNYAQISGFNSSEDVIDTWLITPAIDMSATTGEELSFDLQVNFDNGEILTVWFSNNFTGDPTTADWFQLDADIPTGPSGGFGDFEGVGPINVSCVEGTMHVAFRYQGSDPDATTRYHVDNVTVTGN